MSKTFIVAEIGNSHLGNMDMAKILIQEAAACGVDAVKMQAFLPQDIYWGSKDKEFYKKCSFSYGQYLDLINFADIIKTNLFYSVFSPELDELRLHTKYNKISAHQTNTMRNDWLMEHDNESTFISINNCCAKIPNFKRAKILFASQYLPENNDAKFVGLVLLRHLFYRPIGYSDHTIGIDNCIIAAKEYNCPWIEKHFTIERDETFRDTIHAADQKQMYELVRNLNR
jgi:sialic acid synthase SpsE